MLDADPIAADDFFRVSAVQSTTIQASGVRSNGTCDVEHAVSAVQDSNLSQGSVDLSSTGALTVTPGSPGQYYFTYHLHDATTETDSNTATVVIAVNAPPASQGDEYTLGRNTTLTIVGAAGVLANDGDADSDSLSATLVSDASHGELTFNADGSFVYVADAGYQGDDLFSYTAGDSFDSGALTYVSLHVVNNAPTVADKKGIS